MEHRVESLSYRQLQSLAKKLSIRANQKKDVLIQQVIEKQKESKTAKGLSPRDANLPDNVHNDLGCTKSVGKTLKKDPKINNESISFNDWNIDELTKVSRRPNSHLKFVHNEQGHIVGQVEVEALDLPSPREVKIEENEGDDEEDDEDPINEPVQRMEMPPERKITDPISKSKGLLPAGTINTEVESRKNGMKYSMDEMCST